MAASSRLVDGVFAASSSEDSDVSSDSEQEIDNVFALPWKKSDVILVVGGTDLHVHRSTLIMQSPVFEAMLDGHFLEANQNKITLEEKTVEDMVRFLKLLYPSNMFSSSFTLDEENIIRMLELADEYQAESVINQCLNEAPITPKFVLRLLPFACKYNERVRKKCVSVCQRSVPSKALKKSIPSLDKVVVPEILIGKCDLLEKTVCTASLFLLNSMRNFAVSQGGCKSNRCCFSHDVSVLDFHRARNCRACVATYRERFCDTFAKKVVKLEGSDLINLLNDMDDILSQNTPLSLNNLKRT